MPRNRPESSSSLPTIYRTADGLIRSILDHNASPSDISPSGELYRAIERSYAYRQELVRNHLDRWASQNTMSSDDDPDARRVLHREPRSPNSLPMETPATSAPTLPPLRSISARPSNHDVALARVRTPVRTTGSSRRPPLHWADTYEDALDLWDHWEDDLAEEQRTQDDTRHLGTDVNSRPSSTVNESHTPRLPEAGPFQPRTLLEYTPIASPLPELFPSLAAQQHDPPEENRQAKRRKLDSDRLSSNFQGFQYGKYGQVRPGHLKMELVSCDGGIFSEDTVKYAAENILKNDDSVYCTEGPRCNIVLRHQGATVFTLKELVIKAPRSNFTSPSVSLDRSSPDNADCSMSSVRAGMVFIAMTSDHLLNRTAQYQIQYSPPSRHEREMPPLSPIISIRHDQNGSSIMTGAQVRARRLYNIGLDDEDNDAGVAQIPSEFNVSPSPFHVTTECSDDELDDRNVRLYGRAPNRIGTLPFENDGSDDDEGFDYFLHNGADHRSRDRRETPGIAPVEATESARGVGSELLTPNARFYIKRNKRSCTIRFNPPVSGRFILLKMWNPRRKADDNIDIQAVIAKGYAGPRFFPSIQLR